MDHSQHKNPEDDVHPRVESDVPATADHQGAAHEPWSPWIEGTPRRVGDGIEAIDDPDALDPDAPTSSSDHMLALYLGFCS